MRSSPSSARSMVIRQPNVWRCTKRASCRSSQNWQPGCGLNAFDCRAMPRPPRRLTTCSSAGRPSPAFSMMGGSACRTMPPQPRVPDSADQKLLKTAQILAGERNSIDPSVYHRRLLRLRGRARDLVLTLNRCEAAALLHQVAELINGNSAATPPSVSASTHSPPPGSIRAKGIADRDWMDRLLRGAIKTAEIEPLVDIKGIGLLLGHIKSGPLYQQKKIGCRPGT